MRDQEQKPISRPEPDLQMARDRPLQKGRSRRRSLEDPEAYHDFVDSLFARIEPRMRCKLDEETQMHIANLTRQLTTMPRKTIEDNRVYFEKAFDLLAADEPNFVMIRGLRHTLGAMEERYAGAIAIVILKICGKTPLTSVIAALSSIFILSFVVVSILSATHGLVNTHSASLEDEFPVFFAIKDVPIGQYLLAIHAAFIGSIVSIIVRVRDFMNASAFNPMLVYFSVLTKPVIAATFAILALSVMKAGLISFLSVDLSGPSTPYIAWSVGFLCGFSERFAQDVVSRTGDAIGGSGPPDRKQ